MLEKPVEKRGLYNYMTKVFQKKKKRKKIREIANYFLAPTHLQPKGKDMTEGVSQPFSPPRTTQPTPGRGAKIQSH